ncbi:MAG: hypothetical protein K5889_02205 [Lachnospiraceae bacterium]|jgi:hypothetical protein|nr:hypothetical protein [Lachnospiraceae bacterium]SDW01093.1 hypothetical protein SAMN05216391_10179 [Lachnospiraceae bacterium KHCPX20]
MSIRPVDFNGMIQNTQGVTDQKVAEDHKPIVNQENLSVHLQQEAQEKAHQVSAKQETAKDSKLDPNGKGNSFQDSKKKHHNKKEQADQEGDGKVLRKGDIPSFDIKI